MDVKPVYTSATPPLLSPLGEQPTIGTNIAKDTEEYLKGTFVASTSQSQSTLPTHDSAVIARRIEQSPSVNQQHQLQRKELEKVVQRIEEFVGSTLNKGLAFRIDEESGKSIVTIYDKRTGDVVRQLPDEDMLALSRQLAAHSGGLLTTKV